MTTSITVHCNRAFGHGTCATSFITGARTLDEAHAAARKEGWLVQPDGEDYCPPHSGRSRIATVVRLPSRPTETERAVLGPSDTVTAAIQHLAVIADAAEDDLLANTYWHRDDLPQEHWFAAGIENAVGGPAGQLAGLLGPHSARHLVRLLRRTTRTATAGIPAEAFLLARHITRSKDRR
ncbi:hypothetical protein ABTZ78_17100 [Streptomyces bauhiniae]|uniref:hypothetical protein n=1 Tax=Streptomyces bauhiniae TaxID=2340725 RepID=UPI003323FC3D